MSRDLLAAGYDAVDEPVAAQEEGPWPRRRRVAGLVALVVAGGLALWLGGTAPAADLDTASPAPGDGLRGTFQGREPPEPGLEQLDADLVLSNPRAVPVWVLAVTIDGLGTLLVADPDDALVPAGGTLGLPVRLVVDCRRIGDDPVAVRVQALHGQEEPAWEQVRLASVDPYDVLATAFGDPCPRPRPGAHVSATRLKLYEDGDLLVRLVNHGSLPVQVAPRYEQRDVTFALEAGRGLPLELTPDQAVVTVLRIGPVSGCGAAPSGRVRLVVESADGVAAVQDSPRAAPRLQEALDAAVATAIAGAVAQECTR